MAKIEELKDLLEIINANLDKLPKDKSHRKYFKNVTEVKKLLGSQNISPAYASFIYNSMVLPTIPCEEVGKCLSELKFEKKELQAFIFSLKPFPIELVLLPSKSKKSRQRIIIENILQRDIDNNNKIIKQRSALVGQLKTLQKDPAYNKYPPLKLVIKKLENDKDQSRKIVERKKIVLDKILNFFQISANFSKSSQKHEYWNILISNALRQLNKHYCNCSDSDKACTTTHKKTIFKLAKLLKILYPKIWKDPIKTIYERIKQKDYRKIPI